MTPRGLCIACYLSFVASACADATSVQAAPAGATSVPLPVEPPPPPTDGPLTVHSNTSYVEELALHGDSLWVATRGGLEQYSVITRQLTALYSTRDGLPTLHLESVTVTPQGQTQVTTAKQSCMLHPTSRRFSCSARPPSRPLASVPTHETLEGARITSRLRAPDGVEWLGTAGLGVWVRGREGLKRLTSTDQIASNHVMAIAEWRSATWLATFDRGLSRLRDGHFTTMALGPEMLNDVVGTDDGLFVATSEGLYVSRDGETFHRDKRVRERAINDLAYDSKKRVLYATATNSLWEVSLAPATTGPRSVYRPGGSRSLQAVDVGDDGTVYLASEDRGVLRRDKARRFTGFDRLAGYPSSWATDVLAVDAKTALFGSLRHGVFAVGHAPLTLQPNIDPWILFLGRDAEHPETRFVGTQGGAWLLDGHGTGKSLVGLPNPCVHAIARLASGLWVGTEGGLAVYANAR